MSNDFETSVETHALEYIKLHLREGYFVSAYVDKGTYHWDKIYKIRVSKATKGADDERHDI